LKEQAMYKRRIKGKQKKDIGNIRGGGGEKSRKKPFQKLRDAVGLGGTFLGKS